MCVFRGKRGSQGGLDFKLMLTLIKQGRSREKQCVMKKDKTPFDASLPQLMIRIWFWLRLRLRMRLRLPERITTDKWNRLCHCNSISCVKCQLQPTFWAVCHPWPLIGLDSASECILGWFQFMNSHPLRRLSLILILILSHVRIRSPSRVRILSLINVQWHPNSNPNPNPLAAFKFKLILSNPNPYPKPKPALSLTIGLHSACMGPVDSARSYYIY